MSDAPRLRFAGVTKSFGQTRALKGVSFESYAGEIHAIVGENGAGKSTLMNILAGAFPQDGGDITLGGVPHAPKSPLDARDRGIAMVHQELSLCPHLTVAENILLGMEPARFGIVDRKALLARAEAALAEVVPQGASAVERTGIQPDTIVGDLPPSACQLVEIARALAHPSCRVLVLDEPTSSLTGADAERLFSVIRKLSARGLTILLISHFLEEVLDLAHRYTVLRDGESVASGLIEETSIDALVEKMAGRKGDEVYPPRERSASSEVALEVRGLAGVTRPSDASLTLHRGEILGLFGLVGSGRTELLRAIFGLDPVKNGTLRVGSYVGPASPAARIAQGVGLTSEERKTEGVALSMSIADNVTLSAQNELSRFGLLWPSRLAGEASRWIEKLSIKCAGPWDLVGSLSGGNQQKAALGRLLCKDVDIFLLDEPTRGIDLTSKAQIYRLLSDLAIRGKAILIVSSYLPELMGVCDRIAVMRKGVLGAARDVKALRDEDILREATIP